MREMDGSLPITKKLRTHETLVETHESDNKNEQTHKDIDQGISQYLFCSISSLSLSL